MHKKFLAWAAIFGGLAVILGAFGAHSLEGMTNDEKTLHVFQTGVQYQFYHSLALLALGIVFTQFGNRLLNAAGILFIIGILLFSGSLYGITLLKVNAMEVPKLIGIITPLGGACLILGWAFFFLGMLRGRTSER